jgi:hypothetical protein
MELSIMKRPALATAVLLGAALATAACSGSNSGNDQASSASAAASSQAGTQSYASMLDLYTAVLGSGTHCSNVTIQPTTTAKAQASCDLGTGRSLLLQTWQNAASRDTGVQTVQTALAARKAPYCVVAGTGTTGLWSVAGRGDSGVCATVAHRLGGKIASSAATH